MTTHLFLSRAVELGLSITDLEILTIALVNDDYKYKEVATQDDFDRF